MAEWFSGNRYGIPVLHLANDLRGLTGAWLQHSRGQLTEEDELDLIGPNVARILPALILYHHRRDLALGLAYPGRVTRELIYQYERVKQEQADRILKASFYHGIIQQSAVEIGRLVEQAKEHPDRARDILKLSRKIENRVKKARKELKVLNG
jgi:hypothetical protein